MREALAKGDKAVAEQSFRQTTSALDKAIQKGTLHKNTAAPLQTPPERQPESVEVIPSILLQAISVS